MLKVVVPYLQYRNPYIVDFFLQIITIYSISLNGLVFMGRFVFVTGGVVSGIGKGIIVASLGMVLKSRGLSVTAQKFDPYINVDPGTMSPYQHGEVFVTDDGSETDLDLGHYERFMNVKLNKFSYSTSGKIYWNVLHKERAGEYLGKTVQVIPHITNEIKSYIYSLSEITKSDVVITEIGGTIGDIEGLPFIESIRQISLEVGKENCLFMHVTLAPFIGEYKTKPTQHSVKALQSLGIHPDMIVVRSETPLGDHLKEKIALFCSVSSECVINDVSLPSLYEVPIYLEKSKFSDIIVRKLNLECDAVNLLEWEKRISLISKCKKNVTVSIVGKYIKFKDAYLSLIEALNHAGISLGVKVNINWVDAEEVSQFTSSELFRSSDALLVPGGFGSRGVEGMIETVRYARENNIPFLGICLGMQIAVIEYARNVLGIKDANSSEFDKKCTPVIDIISDKRNLSDLGGTLRLGAFPCKIKKRSKVYEIFQTEEIVERHRHRYEVNNKFRDLFEGTDMVFSGTSPDGNLVECTEIKNHRFFVAFQFHPEFTSTFENPSKIFLSFIKGI